MATISRSALLPFPARSVFDLINDVESYPQYLDGCVGATVFSRDEHSMVARLDLSRAGIRHSFTTRNSLQPPSVVELELVDGPFDSFGGRWTVLALSDSACKVSLQLSFTLSGAVLGVAARQLFNSAANNLVDAMVKRANALYGKR